MRNLSLALVAAVCGLFLLLPGMPGHAETISKVFDHQLLVNSQPQSWEHRIDLPETAAANGRYFIKRSLRAEGKMAIEAEEFTGTYYYVKVKLPKHFQEPAFGRLTVEVEVGAPLPATAPMPLPTALDISAYSPARKPAFIWKASGRYAAITLFDVDTGETIWERVSPRNGVAVYDEPGFLPLHHYRWAVKQSDETGRWSKEAQAAFRIAEQNGVVVVIKE